DPLTLTVTLNRTDQRGFDALLQSIEDPSSSSYQHYLTQQQLADRFGPSQSAYTRVLTWLQGQGFTLTQGSTNRLTLTATGTRALAEHAFNVKINDYELNGRRFYANEANPLLPTSIAGAVQSIEGLSNLAQPRTNTVRQGIGCALLGLLGLAIFLLSAGTGSAATIGIFVEAEALFGCGIGIAICWLSQSYGFPCTASGGAGAKIAAAPPRQRTGTWAAATAQKVGLLEYDTYHASDVANWLALAKPLVGNIDPARLSSMPVNGGIASPGAEEAEVLLDIDLLLANTSPQTNVVVYDAPPSTSFQTLFNAMITDGDTVISNSWSACEDQTTLADVQSIDSILANAAAAGITVINATGDSGSSCLDGSPNTVGFPADAPHATAVGGTSVTIGTGLTYGHETWWDGSTSTPPTGQGGYGTSRFFSRPSYQNGLNTAPMRSVPDVAVNADPAHGLAICKADEGGCPSGSVYGGTSMSAPDLAAAVATLNESKGSNLGFLNPQLYPLADTAGFHTAASMGSDFAHVGLGSPNPDQLRFLLLNQTLGAVSPTVSLVRAAPPNPVSDGTTQAVVQVNLRDAQQHVASGKNVSLAVGLVGGGSGHAVVSAPSGPSSVNGGAVTFTVTDTLPENLVFTATGDGVQLATKPTLQFVTPPAVAANILANPASPTPVTADGTSTATVTVSLQDALGHPAAGKTVTLAQGGGHSAATGSGVSDVSGRAIFTVTDTVTEIVTYTAVDVTDGNLPVPGSAAVNFTNSTTTNCPVTAPVVASGYAVSTFVTGFPGCRAPFGLAFDAGGNLFVTDLSHNNLLKFGPTGGTITAANLIASYPSLPNFDTDGLAFGKDGKLYMALLNGASVWEVNPTTGAFIRQVAATPQFPLGLAVDPLSGDLFVSIGQSSNSIYRISNPGSASPSIAVYSTVGNADGLVFAPDGTLYAAVSAGGVFSIAKIAGTNTGANAGTLLATIPSAHSVDGLGLGLGAGGAVVIYANANDGTITKIDTANPGTQTVIYSGGSRGDFATVGPDGCLYATQDDRILKVTNADGTCTLSPSEPAATLGLSPGTVAPNPQQGTTTSFTATLTNVPNPSGTSITFAVSGANSAAGLVTADNTGKAVFTYSGVHTGADTVVAFTGSGAATLLSNSGRVTWASGNHTTFSTLNQSATAGYPNLPVTVTGNLSDVSTQPATTPLSGQTLSFSLSGAGGQSCTGTTDATGTASCSITPTAPPGSYTLTVSFTATGSYLASSDSAGFTLASGSKPVLQTVTPANGSAQGGKPISIAGTNIQSGASVSIGGRLAGNVVVGAGGTSVSATTPGYIHWGDVSGDTLMTPLDAQCILRLIASLGATQNCPTAALTVTVPLVVSNPGGGSAVVAGGYTYNTADVSGDGAISPLDAQCILRAIASLAATQNCPAPAPPGVPAPRQPRALPPRH
ncbi:MAG: protease pro-enzyme activation domain-containing protein, partial [Dehalococcoidia bacterium]